jgi:hypothetical protein
MSCESGFLDEQGMVDLARKAIEDLRKDGVSPTELKRLENVLREGNVGEAFIVASVLRTVLNEIVPDASHKKLLRLYRRLEECCYVLVEVSRNLVDVEAWQHYRTSGYENFESYCTEELGIPSSKIQGLKLIKDQCLPRPGKGGPADLFSWLFNTIEVLSDAKKRHDL